MGNLISNINGALKVQHGRGTVEFNIRNPQTIKARGARTLLIIEGLGDIPRLENGRVIRINVHGSHAFVTVESEKEPCEHGYVYGCRACNPDR